MSGRVRALLGMGGAVLLLAVGPVMAATASGPKLAALDGNDATVQQVPMQSAPTASAFAAAATQSGTLTVTPASGSLTTKVHFAVTPKAGAGEQKCDPSGSSAALAYATTPGNEFGSLASMPWTLLAPADGSPVAAGGTLVDYLPKTASVTFPADAFNGAITKASAGSYSLGVRCQGSVSNIVYQNYWATISVANGKWAVSTTPPVTTSTPPSTADPHHRTGTLTPTPAKGMLTAGTVSFSAQVQAGGTPANCGPDTNYAVLYFATPGGENGAQGVKGGVVRSRPIRAKGLDVDPDVSLVDFLAAVGGVDFSQSLNNDSTWVQPAMPAGTYSLGVRCVTGTQQAPVVAQNFWTTVAVAADGSWQVSGAAPTTASSSRSTATPTSSSTSSTTASTTPTTATPASTTATTTPTTASTTPTTASTTPTTASTSASTTVSVRASESTTSTMSTTGTTTAGSTDPSTSMTSDETPTTSPLDPTTPVTYPTYPADSNYAGSGGSGGSSGTTGTSAPLAYTGFALPRYLTTAALLLGFGLVALALAPAPVSRNRRRP